MTKQKGKDYQTESFEYANTNVIPTIVITEKNKKL